jgi:hypothetical protein
MPGDAVALHMQRDDSARLQASPGFGEEQGRTHLAWFAGKQVRQQRVSPPNEPATLRRGICECGCASPDLGMHAANWKRGRRMLSLPGLLSRRAALDSWSAPSPAPPARARPRLRTRR